MRTTRATRTGSSAVLLYRLTYSSKGVMFGMLLLVFSILLQPVDFVFANEDDGSATTTADGTSEVTTEADVGGELAEPTAEDGDAITEPAAEKSEETTAADANDEPVEETDEETSEATDGADKSDGGTSTSDTTASTSTVENESATGTSSTTPTSGTEDATSSPALDGDGDQASATNTATSSEGAEEETETDMATSSPSNTLATSTTATASPDNDSAATSSPTSTTDGATSGSGSGGGGDDTTAEATTPTTTPTSTEPTTTSSDEDLSGEETLSSTHEENESPADAGNTEEESAEQDPAASSTVRAPTTTEAVAVVHNDQNRYQFGTSECVSVGDGAFYCSEDTTGGAAQEDGVYAAPDANGDREIFYRQDGAVRQITDNAYEDAAPFLDAEAGEILFHRLIDGRYQIIRYDLAANEEEQLTDSRENNMEPAQGSGVTVWQRWSGGNWEIALADGDGITLITSNGHHDVAPTVRDGYVMWHTTDEEGQKLLSVYEIETGISSSVADPDGGHVENPRFVLVYDTTYENGDSVTKEYDPKTGAVRPVGTDPAPEPVDIPNPDPAGETRALIQSKPNSSKDELTAIEPNEPDGSVGTSTATTTSGAATTTEDTARDLDLSASTTEPLELTEYDVVVEPYAATSSAQAVDTTGTTTAVE